MFIRVLIGSCEMKEKVRISPPSKILKMYISRRQTRDRTVHQLHSVGGVANGLNND